MHHMVRLRGQHALHVVSDVTQDDAIPLGGIITHFILESLDVEALHNRDGKLGGGYSCLFVEDGPGKGGGFGQFPTGRLSRRN